MVRLLYVRFHLSRLERDTPGWLDGVSNHTEEAQMAGTFQSLLEQ